MALKGLRNHLKQLQKNNTEVFTWKFLAHTCCLSWLLGPNGLPQSPLVHQCLVLYQCNCKSSMLCPKWDCKGPNRQSGPRMLCGGSVNQSFNYVWLYCITCKESCAERNKRLVFLSHWPGNKQNDQRIHCRIRCRLLTGMPTSLQQLLTSPSRNVKATQSIKKAGKWDRRSGVIVNNCQGSFNYYI